MTSRPRVLQVVLSLNPGGTERLVVELAARLHSDLPMTVCCLDDSGAWADELRARSVDVVTLGRQPGFHPRLGSDIAAAAQRHEASIIHAHHYSPFVYSCLARLRRPSTSVVFTEHGRLSDAPPSLKRQFVNRALARIPARVFAVSQELKQHLVQEGFVERNVSVIYNGVDVGPVPDAEARRDVRRELEVPEDGIVVGTIARLDPVKDLTTLLQATTQDFGDRPMSLWIIGDGPERDRLEALCATLGSPWTVRFLGQRKDARRFLAGCDMYVNCSVSEGVSLTILEAMAAALPIIGTRVGGTPEVLDDSCGRLVPARDPGRLAEALRALAEHPARRAQLGTAARQRVEARFTLERMIREYQIVYEEVAGVASRDSSRGPSPVHSGQ